MPLATATKKVVSEQLAKSANKVIADKTTELFNVLNKQFNEESVLEQFHTWNPKDVSDKLMGRMIECALHHKNIELANQYFSLLKFRFGLKMVTPTVYDRLVKGYFKEEKYELVVSLFQDMLLSHSLGTGDPHAKLDSKVDRSSLFISMVESKQYSLAERFYKEYIDTIVRNTRVLVSLITLQCHTLPLPLYQTIVEYERKVTANERQNPSYYLVYKAVFESYLKAKEYEKVIELFQQMKIHSDRMCGYALEASVKLGNKNQAWNTFCRMNTIQPEHAASVVWVMVTKYGIDKGIDTALQKLQHISRDYLFFPVISEYANANEITKMEKWIADATEKRVYLSSSPSTLLDVVNAYVRLGSLKRMIRCYKTWMKRNLTLENAAVILRGLLKARTPKHCLEVIKDLQELGMAYNQELLELHILVYARAGMLEEMQKSYQSLVSMDPGVAVPNEVQLAMLKCYIQKKKVEPVEKLMKGRKKDIASLNTTYIHAMLFLAQAKKDEKAFEEAIVLYRKVNPRLQIVDMNLLILEFYGELRRSQKVVDFHAAIIKSGPARADYYTIVLKHIASEGLLKQLEELVKNTPKELLSTKNPKKANKMFYILLKAVIDARNVDQAFSLLKAIVELKFQLDSQTYTMVLMGCGKLNRIDALEDICDFMLKHGVEHTVDTISALMNAYGRAKDLEKVFGFLNKMEQDGLKPNQATVDAVVLSLGKTGNLDSIVRYLNFTHKAGKSIPPSTIAIVLGSLATQKKYFDMETMYKRLKREKLSRPFFTLLIDSFGQAAAHDKFWLPTLENIVSDYTALNNDPEQSVLTAIIKAYSFAKQPQKAYEFWQIAKGDRTLIPSQLLAVAIDAAGFASNHKWFQELLVYIDSPTANENVYVTFIEAYCRLGYYREATDIFIKTFKRFDYIIYPAKLSSTFVCGIRSSGDAQLIKESRELAREMFERYRETHQDE